MQGATPTRRDEWITDPVRFAELRDPWNRLADGSPFLTWDWLDCWWQSFGGGAQMRVCASWDGSELAGGMALGLRDGHLWAMANQETDLYRPLARSEPDLDAVLGAIGSGAWSRITLPGLPLDDPASSRLADALQPAGWLVHRAFRESCAIIDTSGTFEDYLHSLSSKLRGNTKRARRQLEGKGRVELTAVERVDELEPVLAESFALEAAGWKGRSRSAVLSSEHSKRFWHSVFGRYHRLGALRFSALRLDGTLMAFCLDLLHEARLYTLKTSFDEDYARFSPGQILRLGMIERCFDDEIDAQELLGPMHPWKRRYATDARETGILRAYRRRPIPTARYAGRRWVLPRLRPAYRRSRRTLERLRGRRSAAAAQPERRA